MADKPIPEIAQKVVEAVHADLALQLGRNWQAEYPSWPKVVQQQVGVVERVLEPELEGWCFGD